MSRATRRKAASATQRRQHFNDIVDRVGKAIVDVVRNRCHRFLRAKNYTDAVGTLVGFLDHSERMIRRALRLLIGGEILIKQPGGYALTAL